MQLDAYLRRIGHRGPVGPDLETLKAVHRAHALSLVYENLDIQLGVPVTRRPDAIFDKIVRRRRGGWCYEMNGLLAAALDAIGFSVTRLAGAVMRDVSGEAAVGNHLVLLIPIAGETWIGDVGFGDGLIDPARLQEGPTNGNPLDCRLQRLSAGWWRYVNDPRTGGPGFDFHLEMSDERLLDDRCARLQSDPASPFVQNAVVQRWRGERHYSLRGRVLRTLGRDREEKMLIESPEHYVQTLADVFDVEAPEAAALWPKICRRHDKVFEGRDPFV
jgi:N-hydroxyarylamine O-acetyltransferase